MSEHLGLGKIITTPQSRDAIHIAVVPVVAGQVLFAGDKVYLDPYGQAKEASGYLDYVGIADPFLDTACISTGDKFWLYLKPGSITSLKHEWTHPAFPTTSALIDTPPARGSIPDLVAQKLTFNTHIQELADDLALGYDELLDAADRYVATGESHYRMGDSEDSLPTSFWPEYEKVRNVVVSANTKNSFFRCSC